MFAMTAHQNDISWLNSCHPCKRESYCCKSRAGRDHCAQNFSGGTLLYSRRERYSWKTPIFIPVFRSEALRPALIPRSMYLSPWVTGGWIRQVRSRAVAVIATGVSLRARRGRRLTPMNARLLRAVTAAMRRARAATHPVKLLREEL